MKYIRDNIIKYIMDKFIENKLKFKYILSVMIVALIFILAIFVINDKNNLWRYFDIPSLLCVGVLPFFIMCVLFGFSNTKRIFTISFIKDKSDDILNESLLFFKMFNKIIWMSVLLVIIINSIEILSILSGHSSSDMDYRTIVVISLLSPLYAVLINLAITIPYNIIIKRQINNKEEYREQTDDLWKNWKPIKWYHFMIIIINIIIILITIIITTNNIPNKN
jgi:hypothetical protein